MIEFKFENQFGKKESWTDNTSRSDLTKMLKSFYPLFFTADSDIPDYDAMREELKNLSSIKQSSQARPRQARELIKNIFRIPYKCTNDYACGQSPALNTLKDSFGHRVIAHGVEEAKGGLSNILLMLVSGKVLASSSNWGEFLDGPPNISPLCHGPYYLIYSTHNKTPPSNPSFSDIEYILVPFPEHIKLLQEKVASMVAVNLVTQCEQTFFSDRLIDYQGFLNLLNRLELEKESATNKTGTFINSLELEKESATNKTGTFINSLELEKESATNKTGTFINSLELEKESATNKTGTFINSLELEKESATNKTGTFFSKKARKRNRQSDSEQGSICSTKKSIRPAKQQRK